MIGKKLSSEKKRQSLDVAEIGIDFAHLFGALDGDIEGDGHMALAGGDADRVIEIGSRSEVGIDRLHHPRLEFVVRLPDRLDLVNTGKGVDRFQKIH